MIVCVMGRGQSGTRVIAETLRNSGIYMGKTLNAASDKADWTIMYAAVRIMGPRVKYLGDWEWDFTRTTREEVPIRFTDKVQKYLEDILLHSKPAGWKLPETILAYPWITRIYPDAYYIHWVRDPRDCMYGYHITDDLAGWGVPIGHDRTETLLNRAVSWKYQFDIVEDTPRPKHFIRLWYEDWVRFPDTESLRLRDFLGVRIIPTPAHENSVGRHKRQKLWPPTMPQLGTVPSEIFARGLEVMGSESGT